MLLLIVVAAAVLVALAERGRAPLPHEAVRRALESRSAPPVAGFAFAPAVWRSRAVALLRRELLLRDHHGRDAAPRVVRAPALARGGRRRAPRTLDGAPRRLARLVRHHAPVQRGAVLAARGRRRAARPVAHASL